MPGTRALRNKDLPAGKRPPPGRARPALMDGDLPARSLRGDSPHRADGKATPAAERATRAPLQVDREAPRTTQERAPTQQTEQCPHAHTFAHAQGLMSAS